MSVAYKIPPGLQESLGDVASGQFIDVLNYFAEIQRNGYERMLDDRIDAVKETFKEFVDRRIAESEAKSEKRFAEIEVKIAQSESTLRTEIAQNQAALEGKMAQYHTSLLRWMFTFFIGTVIALGGLLFTFVQLLVK